MLLRVLAVSILLMALWSPAWSVTIVPAQPTPIQGFGYGFQSGMAASGCATAPDTAVYGYGQPVIQHGFTCSTIGAYTTCR